MNASEREGTNTELFSRSALQGRMQCTAGTVAVHCGSGCSALQEKSTQWRIRDLSSGVLPSRHQSACGFSFYHGFNGLDGLFPMRDCEQDKNQDKPLGEDGGRCPDAMLPL